MISEPMVLIGNISLVVEDGYSALREMRLKALRDEIMALREEIAAMDDEEEIEEGEEVRDGNASEAGLEEVDEEEIEPPVAAIATGEEEDTGAEFALTVRLEEVAVTTGKSGSDVENRHAEKKRLKEGEAIDEKQRKLKKVATAAATKISEKIAEKKLEEPANETGPSSGKGRWSSVSARQLGASLREIQNLVPRNEIAEKKEDNAREDAVLELGLIMERSFSVSSFRLF